MKKKIAIIGSGISGLTAAYFLSKKYDVYLYEKNKRLGGHTRTLYVEEKSKIIPIDTGFIVAFEATLSYNVTTLPGLRPGTNWKSLFLGGEGLVCRFSGKGKVWIQSRQMSTFLQWVHPYRPVETSN